MQYLTKLAYNMAPHFFTVHSLLFCAAFLISFVDLKKNFFLTIVIVESSLI